MSRLRFSERDKTHSNVTNYERAYCFRRIERTDRLAFERRATSKRDKRDRFSNLGSPRSACEWRTFSAVLAPLFVLVVNGFNRPAVELFGGDSAVSKPADN